MGWSGLQHRKHPANGEAASGTVKPKGRREGAAQPVAPKRAEFSRRGIARQSGALPAIRRSVLLVADWSDAAGSFPTATQSRQQKACRGGGQGRLYHHRESVPPRRGAPPGSCLDTLSYGAPNVKREFFEARQRLFEARPRPTRGFAPQFGAGQIVAGRHCSRLGWGPSNAPRARSGRADGRRSSDRTRGALNRPQRASHAGRPPAGRTDGKSESQVSGTPDSISEAGAFSCCDFGHRIC